MKKMKFKRTMATILSLVLCITMMIPVPIFAGTEKTQDVQLQDYVEHQVLVGYIDSEDVNQEALKEEIKGDGGFEESAEAEEMFEFEKMLESSETLMELGYESVSEMEGVESDILTSKCAKSGKAREKIALIEAKEYTTQELIEGLEKLPNVEYAEPNYIEKPLAVDYTPNQWAYNNKSYGMNVPDWNNQSNVNAPGTVVAVLDTGVDYNNEDLRSVMWTGGNISALTAKGGGTYGIDTSAYGEAKKDPMDADGHGSHCAGIIGAAWNGYGVSGAANGVQIMAVKAGDGDGFYSSDLVEGMEYILEAKRNNVNVVAVNNSWGGNPKKEVDSYVNAMSALGNAGVISVFASGNEYSDCDKQYSGGYYQAYFFRNLDCKIVVNNCQSNGSYSDSSNWGATSTDVYAPGTGIYSTYWSKRYTYASLSGTSMASPAVAGEVAILAGSYPDASIQEIISAIVNNVTPGGGKLRSCVSGGYANVEKAMNALGGVSYSVEHYLQNLDGTYTKKETQNLKGQNGVTVTASPKSYTGYAVNYNAPDTHASDTLGQSKVTLKLYYDRTLHTVTYTDDVADKEIFKDQQHEKLMYGSPTPAFNGTPSREGYEFTGWSPTVSETVTSDVTYKAQWKENKITCTVKGYTGVYDGQEHTGSVKVDPSDAVVKYGTTEGKYTLDAPPKYKDAGTYTVFYQATKTNYPTVTGSFTVDIKKSSAEITQKPTIKTNLNYEGEAITLINGGTVSVGTMRYAIGDSNKTAPTSGWTDNVSNIKATAAGTYYIWYEVVGNDSYAGIDPTFLGAAVVSTTEYTITYNKGDATSGTAPQQQTKEYGQTIQLSENTGNLSKSDKVIQGTRAVINVYMNDGSDTSTTLYSIPTTTTKYSAIGWGTSIGSTVAAYNFGADYSAESSINLYPAWSEDEETVYEAITLPSTWIRPGYNLVGFSASSSSADKVYAPGETFIPEGDINLYAQWTKDHDHVGTKVDLKKATFNTDGNIEYYVCDECGYYFADEACTELIADKNSVIIPKAEIVSLGNRTYNGKKQKANITVTNSRGDDIPFTMTGGSKSMGKGKVTVKLNTEFYSGSKSYSFKINPKGTSVSKVKGAQKSLSVTWKKQSGKMSSKRITGYQVQIATDESFTTDVKSYKVKGYSKTTKTIKSLKSKQKYYVRVRTYYSSYYSKWSAVKAATSK